MKYIYSIILGLCIALNVSLSAQHTSDQEMAYPKKEWKNEKILKGAVILVCATVCMGAGFKIYQALWKVSNNDPQKGDAEKKEEDSDSVIKRPVIVWNARSHTIIIRDSQESHLETEDPEPLLIFSRPDSKGKNKGHYTLHNINHDMYAHTEADNKYSFEKLQKSTQERAKAAGVPCTHIIIGIGKPQNPRYSISGALPPVKCTDPQTALALFETACTKGESVALYIFPELQTS